MNVSSLIGLTTQNKASDFLANAIPSEPQAGLEDTVSTTSKDTTIVTESTSETSTDSTTETSTASEQTEQFTTFLTLLTAQIKNQDPLAPLDSTQFVEQLATFSNLELQAEGNQVLEDIAQMLAQSLYNQTELDS
ncbi:flagellar hook capping protein [Litorimonas taeanensis]|uniref:Basal-body rod modification protein FlgD n=1 Tax=Litorimonas taeanensis TaxID=568099 RepID=A0A420WML0_9PROT|nr:flagellar hook capping FlgD N-terminal domain-containing protein [Litorimonas taeanensis]RKQ72152.1 flagellar hook capping protein [Litorimonas taeanensis]